MIIADHFQYLLRDIYFYDIESCHYQILSSLGFNISHIDESDKFNRNRLIGIMMRDNPRLTKIIRNITTSTINAYLKINKVHESEIILRQYDGVLLTRKLYSTTDYIPLPLRSIYSIFIFSIYRNSYIAYDGNEIVIKGIKYKYDGINYFLKKLIMINYIDKRTVFRQLQQIKNEILSSKNPMNFIIPHGDKTYMFLKQFGQIEISKSLVKIMDVDDIDRMKYFNIYIEPFSKAIVFYYLTERKYK